MDLEAIQREISDEGDNDDHFKREMNQTIEQSFGTVSSLSLPEKSFTVASGW